MPVLLLSFGMFVVGTREPVYFCLEGIFFGAREPRVPTTKNNIRSAPGCLTHLRSRSEKSRLLEIAFLATDMAQAVVENV